jgi:hypothetical protein
MDPVESISRAVSTVFSSLAPIFASKAQDMAREDLMRQNWFNQLSVREQQLRIDIESELLRQAAERRLLVIGIIVVVAAVSVTLILKRRKKK